MTVSVLALTGPSGSGKTAVGFEVTLQLRAAEIPHAYIDTDHLDMVYPQPPIEELIRLSIRNLAAVWSAFAELGHMRLVLSLQAVNLRMAVDGWLYASIPEAEITVVRLHASEATRAERLAAREIGSGLDAHIASSNRAAAYIAKQAEDAVVIETDDRTVVEVAREALALAGWLNAVSDAQ